MTTITLPATIPWGESELDAKVTCEVYLGKRSSYDYATAEPNEVELVEYSVKAIDTKSPDFETKYFPQNELHPTMRAVCDVAVADWLTSNEHLFSEEALLDRDNL